MERESRSRGENFVNKKKLNIVARSVAAVSIATAGVAAVEKTGFFDPLTSSVESASHLVLDNLHKSYDQLIDKLPEVEKAQAASDITCQHPFLTTYWCPSLPHVGDTVITPDIPNFVVTNDNDPCQPTGIDTNGESRTIAITSYGGWKIGGFIFGETSCGKSVGGIAGLPEISGLPQNMTSEKNQDYTTPIAAGGAAAAAVATIAGAAFYTNRKRSSR